MAVAATAPTADPRDMVTGPQQRRRLARIKYVLIMLEVDCRAKLVDIAQEVRAPVSSVFDDLQAIKQTHSFVLLPKNQAPISLDGLPNGWRRIQERKRERQERIIEVLRSDARMPLSVLSRRTGMPISTLSEQMPALRERFAFTIEAKQASKENLAQNGGRPWNA
jgi:hypothetical protein